MQYTNKFIRLHSKCLQVLEAIQALNNRIEQNRATSLELKDKLRFFPSSYVEHYKNRLVIDKAIKDRLVRYYASTFCKLSEDVVAKCYPEFETSEN